MIGRLLILIVGALTAAAPAFVEPYYLTLMVPAFGYGIALLGMNLLLGYTGLLTFGHALFVALGAYSAAYLTSKFGVLYFEADSHCRRRRGGDRGDSGGTAVRALHQDLLRDPDAGVQHAVLFIPVQVLPRHGWR